MALKILEKLNTLLIFFLTRILLSNRQAKNISGPKNVLVICQMGIGNCILFLPVLKNLSLQTSYKITVLVNSKINAEILQRNISGALIQIADPHKMGIKQKISFFINQKANHYDIFICNFLGIKKQFIQLALYCRIPVRIGHSFKGAQGKGKFDFFFNHPVSVLNKHELDFNQELLGPLNIAPTIKQPFFTLGVNESKTGEHFIKGLNHKYKVVLQTYSSFGTHKNWPYYPALAKLIAYHRDAVFILVGSANEYTVIQDSFEKTDVPFINTAGKYTLFETAAIIEKADIYIGNDSGLGHISASLGQKTVTIFGMSDHKRVKPIGPRTKTIVKEMECSPCLTMKNTSPGHCHHKNCLWLLSADDVFKEIGPFL